MREGFIRLAFLALCVWLFTALGACAGDSVRTGADGHILVDVTIAGKPAALALDTGATATVLFRSGAKRLGLKINEPAPGKEADEYAETEECEFRLKDKTIQHAFIVIDMPKNAEGVDGVIGWPNVGDSPILFDVSNREIQSLKEVPAEVKAWQNFKVLNERQLKLEVPTDVGAKTVLIDTGDTSGVELSGELWKRKYGEHQTQPTTVAVYVSHSGLVVSRELWAAEWSIGALKLRDVPVSEPRHGTANPPGFDVTLGLYGLRRFPILVDSKNGVAYVKPSEPVSEPYAHNRMGAVFTPVDFKSDPLLAHVAKGSPADLAGIRDGDVLLTVNDADVTNWRGDSGQTPARGGFAKPGGTAGRVSLERGGEKRTVSVVLKDILGPAPQVKAEK